jgi:2-succinyl-6-hydroxy-2,4-cyclohexadiene-1-carboxylate synthase
MRIFALHGFLGGPRDFLALKISGLRAYDIFLSEACPMPEWAKRFNRGLPQSSIILGYSMGGRLALHALLLDPKRFRAAIIVAAHPGLAHHREKEERLSRDRLLAKDFQNKSWPELMNYWNNLEALKGSVPIKRHENDYCRNSLARALSYFSLGNQEDLSVKINMLDLPILWLAPKDEADKIARLNLKHHHSELIYIEGGHRFIFSKAEQIAGLIHRFLLKIRE